MTRSVTVLTHTRPQQVAGALATLVAAAPAMSATAPARPGSASQTNVSRLPLGPGRPLDANPITAAGASCATATIAARRSARSRTTPFLPILSRPTSNCGLTIARQSKRSAAQRSTAGSTFSSEMNDTSATISPGR